MEDVSGRRPLQPYPTLFTTFSGAALNGLLLYSMTWEYRINGLALAALGSAAVNFSHKVMKDSGGQRSATHSLHKNFIQPIAFQLANKIAPKHIDSDAHHRAYYEFRRDTQIVLASVVSTVVLGLLNHFILKADGVGLSGAFALSMVPALYTRSVQIRYDWEETNNGWGMCSGESRKPIYAYDVYRR